MAENWFLRPAHSSGLRGCPTGIFPHRVALLRLAFQALKPLHCIMFSTFLLECPYGLSQEVMRSMSLEVCKQGSMAIDGEPCPPL